MNVKRTKLCLCRSLLLMTGLLFAVASFAQDLTVKGKVTDTTGETVIGANVTVRGTTNGIITDIDGNYTLSGVKPSSVLVFSFIGYKTQEIPCSGRQEINVVLSEDAQALDEVVGGLRFIEQERAFQFHCAGRQIEVPARFYEQSDGDADR